MRLRAEFEAGKVGLWAGSRMVVVKLRCMGWYEVSERAHTCIGRVRGHVGLGSEARTVESGVRS